MRKSFIIVLSVCGVSLGFAGKQSPTISTELADEYDIAHYTTPQNSLSSDSSTLTISDAHKDWNPEDKRMPKPIPSDAINEETASQKRSESSQPEDDTRVVASKIYGIETLQDERRTLLVLAEKAEQKDTFPGVYEALTSPYSVPCARAQPFCNSPRATALGLWGGASPSH